MTLPPVMKSPLAGILPLERPLIVLDYETTSADPAEARICSIGMRRHLTDGTLQAYKTLVNPGVPMPESAADTHKITQAIIDSGCAVCWKPREFHPWEECETFRVIPSFAQLAPRLHPVMHDVDFAGYNIQYDLRVAAEEFARNGMEFDYSGASIIDSLRIEQILEPRRLSDVYERRTGKKLDGAHDAMVDVEATEEVLIAQLTGHERSDVLPRNVAGIHDLLWPRDPNALDREGKFIYVHDVLCFGFGKHKGRPVHGQLAYVKWMLGANFSPEVRKLCDAILAGQVLLRRIKDLTP